jgi:MFS family permease
MDRMSYEEIYNKFGWEKIKVAFAAQIGSIIDWYDFFLVGLIAALVWNKTHFPTNVSPSLSIFFVLLTYSIAYVSRPIGAIVFGHYGDKIGRKAMMIITLILCGGSMFAIVVFGLPPLMRAISPLIRTYQIAIPLSLERPKVALSKSMITGFMILLIAFLVYYTPLSSILTIVLRFGPLEHVYLLYLSLFTASILFVAPYIVSKRVHKS